MNDDWKKFPCDIRRGRVIRALYIKLNGPLEKGMNVLHYCDNPTCRTPQHWFLGTQSENLIDAINKGRNKGTWKPKVTVDQVREIRKSTEFTKVLANRYNVSEGIIRRIRNNSRWKNVR